MFIKLLEIVDKDLIVFSEDYSEWPDNTELKGKSTRKAKLFLEKSVANSNGIETSYLTLDDCYFERVSLPIKRADIPTKLCKENIFEGNVFHPFTWDKEHIVKSNGVLNVLPDYRLVAYKFTE